MSLIDFIAKAILRKSQKRESTLAPNDWRSSRPHLFFLSRFLCSQDVSNMVGHHWDHPLKEPPIAAIARFREHGILIPAAVVTILSSQFKITDLKSLLKERGLRVSGSKEQLAERLIEADPSGMARLTAHFDVLECSPEARLVAETILADEEAERQAAVRDSFAHLRTRNFHAAAASVAHFESNRVFPRGIGIDWAKPNVGDVEFLRILFESRPKILGELSEAEWLQLRLAAAMMNLWGSANANAWLPSDFRGVSRFDNSTAARMIVFHSSHLQELAAFRAAGIKRVSISRDREGSCSSCRSLPKRSLLLDEVPELPYAECTHPMGCRCEAVAKV